MNWKSSNTTLQILKNAENGKYGVLATIAYTLDHVIAMVQAAENKRSPLIIQFFPWAITHSKGNLIRAAKVIVEKASVPVALHLDHCQDEDIVRFAASELPFDSIMVDMSHYEKEENLRKTKELVKFCNEHRKATEAEPGRIEGGEDGIMDTEELEGILTTPEEAELFLQVGIDILSPAIGNFHGDYPPAGPQLRFDLLEALESYTKPRDVRLCLHGTNDFTPDLLHDNIDRGVSKINVNKLVLDTHLEFFQKKADQVPLTTLLDDSNKILVERMEYWMDQCRSAGKAK
ncbi:hypothetical protein KL906_001114 [Ogataea polymorpha]|nr:hypothetical protein KL906_001114 [Ogataea polymorpha]